MISGNFPQPLVYNVDPDQPYDKGPSFEKSTSAKTGLKSLMIGPMPAHRHGQHHELLQ